ncbi:MAG: hypothetical protein RBT73_10305, partial [Spirochaetia bacterium]|nr:hypothetical protein [Spirochaetia bacterium]
VVSGRVGLAAAALDDSSPFSVLEGEYLTEAEMEDIVGGLPRMCHHPQYDAIEDKCLNNKGQEYLGGINDCDIWAENNLHAAGYEIATKWGSAQSKSVKQHIETLKGQLTDSAPLGWSIEFINNSHVALVRVNSDGSADLFHQGYNAATPNSDAWEGSRGYHYSNAKSAYWGDNPKFWKFN